MISAIRRPLPGAPASRSCTTTGERGGGGVPRGGVIAAGAGGGIGGLGGRGLRGRDRTLQLDDGGPSRLGRGHRRLPGLDTGTRPDDDLFPGIDGHRVALERDVDRLAVARDLEAQSRRWRPMPEALVDLGMAGSRPAHSKWLTQYAAADTGS